MSIVKILRIRSAAEQEADAWEKAEEAAYQNAVRAVKQTQEEYEKAFKEWDDILDRCPPLVYQRNRKQKAKNEICFGKLSMVMS